MQFFPGDSHCFTRFQIFHSTSHFLVPRHLDGFVRSLKTVEQGVGQRSALVNREGERPF